MSIRRMGLRGLRTLTALAAGALALTACAVGPAGGGGGSQDADKPVIRLAYQAFPSGDLIVKHNRRRTEPDPDVEAMAAVLPRLLARANDVLKR